MNDFRYYNPTKIEFGRGKENNIGRYIKEEGVSKVLLVYGTGSIKKSGLYDKVVASLSAAEVEFVEMDGIVSNPLLSRVYDGVSIAKEHDLEAVLGVGGGSVIDSAKAIAAGAMYEGDVWDFFINKAEIKKALPVFAVMTLAAAASEMNGNAVITRDETQQKYSIGTVKVNPRLSVINPELMATVSNEYLAYSAVDIIAHTIEVYFTATVHPAFNASLVESIIKAVMRTTEILLENPDDYDARAEFAWVSLQALNGLTPAGTAGGSFANHLIEHSLSALYNVPHGAGLAIVIPAWMQWHKEQNIKQYERFAREIFGAQNAEEGIKLLEAWFKKIGAPTSLKDANISKEDIEKIAQNASETAKVWGMDGVYMQDVITEILLKA